MPFAGGELEPARRLACVLLAALPGRDHLGQGILRVSVPEIGSGVFEVASRTAGIGINGARNAALVVIAQRHERIGHKGRIGSLWISVGILAGDLGKKLHRPAVVLGHQITRGIHAAELPQGAGMTLAGSEVQGLQGGLRITRLVGLVAGAERIAGRQIRIKRSGRCSPHSRRDNNRVEIYDPHVPTSRRASDPFTALAGAIGPPRDGAGRHRSGSIPASTLRSSTRLRVHSPPLPLPLAPTVRCRRSARRSSAMWREAAPTTSSSLPSRS
jgi:hypothetical protein